MLGSAKTSSVRSKAKQERRREAHANALVGVLGSLSRSGKYENYEAAVAAADRAQTYLSVKAKLQDKFDESCFQHSWVAVVGERANQNKPDGWEPQLNDQVVKISEQDDDSDIQLLRIRFEDGHERN
eukprot:SAG11_NODE_17529_length_515_cov_3.548077_1_plen_126_part_10